MDQIIIVDSGSTDETLSICTDYGADIIEKDWPGMVKQREYCLEAGKNYQWILLLDSDESLDKTLQQQVQQVQQATCQTTEMEGYSFNRKVWFLNGWLNHVFQPEHRLRLVRSGKARVTGIGPDGLGGHDQVRVDGKTALLSGTCKHDSWEDLDDMLKSYIRLGRRAATYDPKQAKLYMLFLNPVLAFFKQFILKKGYKDGQRGLIACVAIACGNLIKQLQKFQNRQL